MTHLAADAHQRSAGGWMATDFIQAKRECLLRILALVDECIENIETNRISVRYLKWERTSTSLSGPSA